MLSWILIPLQYLFVVRQAERYAALAMSNAGKPDHHRYLRKSAKYVYHAEMLQLRFPTVTDPIDTRRAEKQLRDQIAQ